MCGGLATLIRAGDDQDQFETSGFPRGERTRLVSRGDVVVCRRCRRAERRAGPLPSLFTGTSFQVTSEFGIMGNSGNPPDGQNVGQLYTDRANEPQLDQVFATLTKPIDSAAKD